MSNRLHDRLLLQARHLAEKDAKRPQQASLRRAISTAYYALFHLLIDQATRSLSRGTDKAKLRLLLSRAFSHEEMAAACRSFGSGGALPQVIQAIYGPLRVPGDLRVVAETFVNLQKARHDADYAIHMRWTRTEALAEVRRAEQAFDAWSRISSDAMAPLFLSCLLTWKRFPGR